MVIVVLAVAIFKSDNLRERDQCPWLNTQVLHVLKLLAHGLKITAVGKWQSFQKIVMKQLDLFMDLYVVYTTRKVHVQWTIELCMKNTTSSQKKNRKITLFSWSPRTCKLMTEWLPLGGQWIREGWRALELFVPDHGMVVISIYAYVQLFRHFTR